MVQKFNCGIPDYLPGDLLVKTDRASMFFSLELRSPFLSFPLFELAWQLSERDLLHQRLEKLSYVDSCRVICLTKSPSFPRRDFVFLSIAYCVDFVLGLMISSIDSNATSC